MTKLKKKQLLNKSSISIQFKQKREDLRLKGKEGAKHLVEHEQSSKWFEMAEQFREVRSADQPKLTNDDSLAKQMQAKAEELLRTDTQRYQQSCRLKNRGDADWLDTVAQRGTFADRQSALQLSIQRSPVHALHSLAIFVQLVQQKGAKIRQAHSVTRMLKELFLSELLPPDRKLIPFNQRPLEKYANQKKNDIATERRLIFWHYEAQLKQIYRHFLEGLQSLAGNTVEGVAETACREMAELLTERPEQEQFLLAAVVNKLGHPQHRVGAKVAQMLEQLVQKHPNMRPVVAQEVEQLVFRKNILLKAQRYGIHFLSRMLLDAGESELAIQLIQIYLRLFRILVIKEALGEHKLLPLLVTGLIRAFPYARGKMDQLMPDVDSLYAIVQTAKFSTALSVLRLLFQIHSTSDGLSDRFYCALYRRLLNLQPGSQQDSQFFTLMQQVLKHDLVESRVRAFMKRLFQIALSTIAPFAAATLLCCHSVLRERPQLLRIDPLQLTLTSNLAKNEEEEEDDERKTKIGHKWVGKKHKKKEVEVKREEEGNVEDDGIKGEKKAHLLRQWFENDDEGEDEEHYVDVVESCGEEEKKPETSTENFVEGWVHRRPRNGIIYARGKQKEQDQIKGVLKKRQPSANQNVTESVAGRRAGGNYMYDSNARNPLFAGAEFTLDTELYTLAVHYHPTVAAFARALIKGELIHYKGDPLIDLSQMRFLDRFAFKNPKKKFKMAKDEEQQSKKSLFANSYTPQGVKAMNPTSQDYISKKSSEIPLDERFLHHFAALKFKKNEKNKKGADDEDDEVASLNSDEFDMLMEKFEPGETREIFDVDFTTEFGGEADTRQKRKALKRKRMVNEGSEGESDGSGAEDGLAGSDLGESGNDESEAEEKADDDDEPDSEADIGDFDDEFREQNGMEEELEEEELEFD